MNNRIQELTRIVEAAKDAYYLLKRGYKFESTINFISSRFLFSSFEKSILIRLLSGYNVRFRKIRRINRHKVIYIDGYNVLITLSVILNKGILVKSIDGLIRDIESKHGKNISLENMKKSVNFLENFLRNKLRIKSKIIIVLEKNISKSGKLSHYINNNTSLESIVMNQVDNFLINKHTETFAAVATSDSLVISRLGKVFPVTNLVIELGYFPRILVSFHGVKTFY